MRPRGFEKLPAGPFRVVDGYVEEFPTDGYRVASHFERNLVFTNGKWVGKRFVLQGWQEQLLIDAFELREDGVTRRYRDFHIWVPKKQGKTETGAGLGHWAIEASGEPSPSTAICASAEDQADVLFGAAKTMAEQSPSLRGLLEIYERQIQVPGEPNAWLRRVPANGGKFDGKLLFMALCDEIHEWLTANQRKMYGMLRGALAVRDAPMFVTFSTAGESEADLDEDEWSPWWRLWQYTMRMIAGEIEDETTFVRLWQAPDGVDYRDPSAWADPGTNPSYGVTVQEAFYRSELSKRTASEFARYYLNRPQESISNWLEPGDWDACGLVLEGSEGEQERLWEEMWRHEEPTWLGWDASTKRDSTVIVAVQWCEIEGRRRLLVRSWFWERPMIGGEWDQSWRVPTDEVTAKVADLHREYQVMSCGYDPYFIAWVAEGLLASGLPLIEWPQTSQRMAPATQALYEMVTEKVLAHRGEPRQNRHIAAVKAKLVRGGQVLVKGERGRRVDFAIALAMAVSEAIGPSDGPSVYEERGAVVL